MSVIIIGCGIAGPVLAMLLKHKGFEPVIYESHDGTAPNGLSLGISPQTFKTLDIVGLAHDVLGLTVPLNDMRYFSALQDKELFRNDRPTQIRAHTGWPIAIISRPVYNTALWEGAKARGIPVHFKKKLVNVEQTDEKVTAMFEDGTKAEGDILVGCDGLHSVVREALFGQEPANFMGIVQVGGVANMPDSLRPARSMYQVYGDGCSFLAIPINEDTMLWAVTMAEEKDAREDWKTVSLADADRIMKTLPPAQWSTGPCKEIMANTIRLVKYGIYDRPLSPLWHKGRVVLCGDAAHPTSPHIGQGANQAMEDCYHLTRLLVQNRPLTSESTEKAFTEFEQLRMPNVTAVINFGKQEGETRVTKGEEACKRRDDAIAQGTSRDVMKLYAELVKGPYVGKSEI